MKTIKIVIDKTLLQAADRATLRMTQNRSALIREALREHLKKLGVRISEERDREGYTNQPQGRAEGPSWEVGSSVAS